LWLALACAALAGCSKSPFRDQPKIQRPKPAQVTISAAASTKEALEQLAAQFTKTHGGEVHVNAAASSTLASQIIAGAPADLFLSASQQWADEIEKRGLAEQSVPLLTNKLVMIVPRGNPAGVHMPDDLLSDKVQKIALAGEKVPAGIYANQALAKLGLSEKLSAANKIAHGQDVRAALGYVERGEAEAGIVYSTDVSAAKNVEQVYEFAPQLHDPIVYVVQHLEFAKGKEAARQFFDYLQSPDAEKVFQQHGFTRLANSAVQP
jgi:molybdate transport system substrate-binding protein